MKKVLFCFLIIASCSKKELPTYKEMKSDKLMTDSFNDSELKDLAKIVDFFENEICENFNEGDKSDIKRCYDKFNVKDTIASSQGSHLKFIDIKLQRKMYKKIDSATLYSIWRHGRCYPDTLKISENLGLRAWDGKYVEFIKKVGEKEEFFKNYAESLYISNGLGPGQIFELTMFYKTFNISDIKVRLLYAIQYLTINENLDYRIKKPCS